MSLERDYFGRYRPAFAKLEPAGFQKDGNQYIYRETFLDGQFEARITVQPAGEIRGEVIDLDTEEEYLPIRARHQVGGFVGSVREAYLEVLEQVRTRCFAPVDFVSDQANRVSGMIGGIWGTAPVFPWEKYPGNAAFHCDDNDKWFALVLTVAYGKLASAKAGQAYELGFSHAHAWTEIYIDGYGWVPMEFTSAWRGVMPEEDLSRGLESISYESKNEELSETPLEEAADEETPDYGQLIRRILLAAAIVLLALILLWILIRKIRQMVTRMRLRRSFADPDIRKGYPGPFKQDQEMRSIEQTAQALHKRKGKTQGLSAAGKARLYRGVLLAPYPACHRGHRLCRLFCISRLLYR